MVKFNISTVYKVVKSTHKHNDQQDSIEIYLHLESGIESVGDQTSKALSARSSGFRWDSGWSSGSVAWKSLPTLILILSTETAMHCSVSLL